MLQAKIKDSYGKEIATFEIPQNMNELRYSMYVEYSCYTSEIFDWVKSKQDKEEEYYFEYQIQIAKAVCKIFSTPENIIEYDVIKNLKYKDQDWLWSAWKWIEDIIGKYEPQTNGGKFVHKNVTYTIPEITKSIVTGEVYSEDLTFQQTSEIAEIERNLKTALSKIKEVDNLTVRGTNFEKVEAIASATYAATIQKIALCLSDPKEVPVDSTYSKWLDEKSIELMDISANNALDTIFFLMNMSGSFGTLIELSHILKASNLESSKTKRVQTTTLG